MDPIGTEIYALCERLFPICRSITGSGVRQTLSILAEYMPGLKIYEVPSGTRAFDWVVPKEWNIRDAYILDPGGRKVVDFKDSNLHVVGYSVPVDQTLSLEELQGYLHSIPEQPDAVPYITSYYEERWGFCLADRKKKMLKKGQYRVFIDSSLKEGSLTYGELILPGKSEREVFLSTYICHPSMANNEISGPAVTAFLARHLQTLASRRHTYRIIFVPETIGSIVYLSRNLEAMKKNVVAGFNITCVGDDRAYSYLPSRYGITLADRAARHVLSNLHPGYISYSFLDRDSDERQYCSPGVDLPVVSVMRSKYRVYPEYHTSLDNLALITPQGLAGGYETIKTCLECIERNETLKVKVLGEPQLGRRNLYPSLSTKNTPGRIRDLLNVLAYCDGTNDLIGVADLIKTPVWELYSLIDMLKKHELLDQV